VKGKNKPAMRVGRRARTTGRDGAETDRTRVRAAVPLPVVPEFVWGGSGGRISRLGGNRFGTVVAEKVWWYWERRENKRGR